MKSATIPLLHDNHNHVSLYAALSSCSDLSSMAPAAARAFLESLPPDRLSVARGWRTNELPLGSAELARLPPVLLINFSLHGFAISESGLPFLKKAAPELAERRGDPSWIEANVPALFAAYSDLAGVSEAKLTERLNNLLQLGIGSTDDMTVATPAALDLNRSGAFAGRVSTWVAPSLFRRLDGDRRSACAGLKIFLDGAFGSRSAAIAGPWIGPGKAFFAYSDGQLDEALDEIAGWGGAVAIHAIGELAVEQAVRALESARARGRAFPLVRLEHVQMITRDQALRTKRLGVTLSMQPNFSSDSRDYTDRIPSSYLEANNPFRMLIDEAGFAPGKDLLFGSDGMPDGIAYAATEALFPTVPGQRMSLEELAAGYGPARGISGKVRLEIDEKARQVRVAEVEASSYAG